MSILIDVGGSARSSSLRPASLPGSSPRRTSLAIVRKPGHSTPPRRSAACTRRQRASCSSPHARETPSGRRDRRSRSEGDCRPSRTVPDTTPYGDRYSAARCPMQRRTVPQTAPHGTPDLATLRALLAQRLPFYVPVARVTHLPPPPRCLRWRWRATLSAGGRCRRKRRRSWMRAAQSTEKCSHRAAAGPAPRCWKDKREPVAHALVAGKSTSKHQPAQRRLDGERHSSEKGLGPLALLILSIAPHIEATNPCTQSTNVYPVGVSTSGL